MLKLAFEVPVFVVGDFNETLHQVKGVLGT